MTLETSLALIIFLFPLAYSPGPGNMFFAANGARFGVRATWPANIGYHVATWLVTILIGFGFAATMKEYPQIFLIIQYAGSVYVLYLAWKLFRAGAFDNTTDAQPAGFMGGVLLMVLNPKAYLIISVMFSQFLANSQIGYAFTVLWISTVFTVNNLLAFLIWAYIGDRIAARLKIRHNAKRLNIFFGAVLAIVAIWMLMR